MPPHLTRLIFKTALCPPSSPTHWTSTTCGEVENLPTSEIRQGNLELTALPHSFDNTRNTKMLPCPHPTSTLLWATPRTKWCQCSQPWATVFRRLYRPSKQKFMPYWFWTQILSRKSPCLVVRRNRTMVTTLQTSNSNYCTILTRHLDNF